MDETVVETKICKITGKEFSITQGYKQLLDKI